MIARNLLKYLDDWSKKTHRKPLVLRGARQVGKSSLVRELGRTRFKELLEINLEANPEIADLVVGRPVGESIELLSTRFRKTIVPGSSLVFFDEIQVRPDLLAALRFWAEELPEQHVVAAGSLLDFALEKFAHPVPVGRIEYCYVGPLNFEEFLAGVGDKRLVEILEKFQLGDQIPDPIHNQLLSRVRDYWIVGGMPEAVAAFAESSRFAAADQIKRSIASTYRDDFGKYGTRIDLELVRKVYQRVPLLVGQRAKFVAFERDARALQVARALEMLTLARVITRVRNTTGMGVPLGAEADDRMCKYLFVDVGLLLSLCDLSPFDLEKDEDLMLVNRGAVAEQFIGQHLLYSRSPYQEPELYYWERIKRNASAEVDYLISDSSQIVPIEVKAGAPGRLQSLQVFLAERKSEVAVRFSSAPAASVKMGKTRLISLPLYLVGQVRRLIG